MSTTFLDKLRRGPMLADGAMGTEIFARGISFDRCFDALNLSQPNLILDIHRRYVEAGAEVLETNTFGANAFRLGEHGLQAQVVEMNQSGVRLARMAVDESRRKVYVAGSVGPLGVRLAPLGRVQPAQARQAFREQIGALHWAGIDLLIFETFSDLIEIREAILAAREVAPDVPLVAQMTFTEDGRTPLGDSAEAVARALLELKVDVIGANCSVGPARLLPVVNLLANHANGTPISVMPNAGWPQRVGPRIIYPATPDYFSDYTRRFLIAGATLIGGCCGTTPQHIGKMRAALDEAIAQRVVDSSTPRVEVVNGSIEAEWSGREELHPPTRLQEKLARGEFVTAVEVDPPKGHNAGRILEAARELGRSGVDVINVADAPMARMRMSAWALAHLMQREADLETVLHFPTRGRNLIRVQGDLLAAHALGVRNLFVTMGDPPAVGDYPEAGDHHDIVPTGLLKMLKENFNTGRDHAGKSIGGPTGFFVGVALNFGAPDLEREIKLLRKKIACGADFALTQPVFDTESAQRFIERYRDQFGDIPLPIIAGVLPPASLRNAEFLHNEVPGIHLPDRVLERMRGATDERREGIRIAQEALQQLQPLVQGVYVMPMLGRYDSAAEVIEVVKVR
ncbi:MAG TPA: bifunctional homocysteine S-methyltransferase/methylenetetrahydrofolate reductase [Anaerolineae bacterium]|nr:bifunctional homocysteine S-methyltransferase/methylenetetrahydrofolate reductase [Anaerolineae bacterium]